MFAEVKRTLSWLHLTPDKFPLRISGSPSILIYVPRSAVRSAERKIKEQFPPVTMIFCFQLAKEKSNLDDYQITTLLNKFN
jgi:hypothetical protein